MARLMQSQPFHAYEYDGVTYDCGDKIGLLRANVALALKRPDLAAAAYATVSELLATAEPHPSARADYRLGRGRS
jgi:UTP--glucose-1-phosphate uridylyltransferase